MNIPALRKLDAMLIVSATNYVLQKIIIGAGGYATRVQRLIVKLNV
jgi:hypothetical protein